MIADIPFIQAKNCGPVRDGAPILLIVIHTMEYPEREGGARWCGSFFGGQNAPEASAHYGVDSQETYQYVRDNIVAWAAPGANRDGIHIEHVGYAKQDAADWADEYSESMLQRSAELAASLCRIHRIPIQRVEVAELVSRKATGFCGHVDVTNARNGGKGHQDPGLHFPWDHYLDLVYTAYHADDTEPDASANA